MKSLTPLVILVVAISSALTLDFKGVEETFSCDKYTDDPTFDPSFIDTAAVLYTTFWNKVDFYQNAEDFFGREEFSKLSQTDLDKTCIYYKPNGTTVQIYGFDGRVLNYESFPDPIRKGMLHWAIRGADGNREYHATSHTTLSDNKTYFFAVTLWWNGMKGFNVGSTVPTFDELTLNKLKQHATDLGFDPKLFEVSSYENCPPPPSFFFPKSTPEIKNN